MAALTEDDIRGLQATLRELQERVGNMATTNVQLQNSLQAEQQSRAQAEARFAIAAVRPVTLETSIGKDGADVAIEVDGLRVRQKRAD